MGTPLMLETFGTELINLESKMIASDIQNLMIDSKLLNSPAWLLPGAQMSTCRILYL